MWLFTREYLFVASGGYKKPTKKTHKKGQWEVRGVLTFDIHFRTFANFHMGTWHLGGPFAPPLAQLYICN